MKTNNNIYILCLLFLSASFSLISCKVDDAEIPKNSATKIKFNEQVIVSIPLSTKKRNMVKGTIIGYFDEVKEEVTEFQISANILNNLNLSEDEFNTRFNEEMSKILTKSSRGEHSKCIEGCKDKYTDDNGNKIKGRGDCKFNCWVDTVVTIIEAIGDDLIKAIL